MDQTTRQTVINQAKSKYPINDQTRIWDIPQTINSRSDNANTSPQGEYSTEEITLQYLIQIFYDNGAHEDYRIGYGPKSNTLIIREGRPSVYDLEDLEVIRVNAKPGQSVWIRQEIQDFADKIRSKIKSGNLYGEPVDIEDVDSLIVAAYMAGQMDKGKEANE